MYVVRNGRHPRICRDCGAALTMLGERGQPRSKVDESTPSGWSKGTRVEVWECPRCRGLATFTWVPTWTNSVARYVDACRAEILSEHFSA